MTHLQRISLLLAKKRAIEGSFKKIKIYNFLLSFLDLAPSATLFLQMPAALFSRGYTGAFRFS
jgi:hypothetical protein